MKALVGLTEWIAAPPGALSGLFDPLRIGASGHSLGGNFALRIASAEGPALGLARVVAICPVLDPEETMAALFAAPRPGLI